MKLTPTRLLVLGICLVMLAGTVPGLMQSPAVAGPRVMKPGDDGGGSGGSGPALENVLIRADKPYTDVVAAINAAGGSVSRTYNNFDGIAASIPRSAIRTIGTLTGPERISKDLIVPAPTPKGVAGKTTGLQRVGSATQAAYESATAIAAADFAGFAASHPDAYLTNNASTHVNALHAAGYAGQGMVVGIIDSGIRPGFPHLGLDGSVIGCEDFVGDAFGCSHVNNSGHGTFVAGMVSANVNFTFNPAGFTFQAIAANLPGAVIGVSTVPMIGSAPLSSIYAFRVFPPTGGAATSDILAAMDRAIELRELYEDGDPAGVKISVVNMSLGGPT
ncbi:MAG TPA: S8 family serine peptidase, partial [Candidatus Polarisedimenticolia bacterium]|nr:S8 family serine peptidase [Candidatus Polarisedimenticolia bacterium]